MRILWVFNHPAPYKVDFFNELGKHCELTVLFERGNESDRNKLFYYEKPSSFHMVLLDALPLGASNGWTREIVKHLKHEVYDIVVMNGYSTLSEMFAISFLQRRKIPYVFAINGGIIPKHESHIKKLIKHSFIKGADAYLCPDTNSEKYLTYYGADKDKIVIYPYSTVFESERLKKAISIERRTYFWKKYGFPTPKVFICAGQFIKRKNLFLLLDYWKDVPSSNNLLLLGSGPLKKKLEKRIASLGLNNVKIEAYKPHKETLRFLSMADASIFLTKEDIYGHVVNESLSQGTPVIASSHSNASIALISNESNGFIIKDGDEKSFIKALGLVNQEMKEKALASSKDETIEAMAAFHLSFFKDYLKK